MLRSSWLVRQFQRQQPFGTTARVLPSENRAFLALENLEERIAPTVDLVSTAHPSFGSGSKSANGLSVASNQGSVSDDGRYVVYRSEATNVVSGQTDTNDTFDVFLFDTQTETTKLISRKAKTTTTAGDGKSLTPTISGNGKWVAFVSESTDMIDGVTIPSGSTINPSSQVYLYDVENDTLSLVTYKAGSTTLASNGNDADTAMPSLSNDGRYLAFISDSTDLITGQTSSRDSNSFDDPQDAFVYDRVNGTISMVSHVTSDAKKGGNEITTLVTISGNGNKIAFVSYATNLGQTETRFSTSPDIFLYDVSTTAVTLPMMILSRRPANRIKISCHPQSATTADTWSTRASRLIS